MQIESVLLEFTHLEYGILEVIGDLFWTGSCLRELTAEGGYCRSNALGRNVKLQTFTMKEMCIYTHAYWTWGACFTLTRGSAAWNGLALRLGCTWLCFMVISKRVKNHFQYFVSTIAGILYNSSSWDLILLEMLHPEWIAAEIAEVRQHYQSCSEQEVSNKHSSLCSLVKISFKGNVLDADGIAWSASVLSWSCDLWLAAASHVSEACDCMPLIISLSVESIYLTVFERCLSFQLMFLK